MASCICFIRIVNVCVIVQSECNVTFVSTLELSILVNYGSVLKNIVSHISLYFVRNYYPSLANYVTCSLCLSS